MADGLHMELAVRDLSGLVANFYAAEAAVLEAFKQAARNAAELIQQVVQSICAVDTGFMREHVRAWFTQSGLGFEVGWDASDFLGAGLAFYPFFVEFGTRYMAAQPALMPAYDYVAPMYQQDVAELVRVALAMAAA